MREWRKTHRLEGEARMKANARAYLHVYVRRGKVLRKPCEVCGELRAEPHHEDYRKPLVVRWLCVRHHMELEGKVQRVEVLLAAAETVDGVPGLLG